LFLNNKIEPTSSAVCCAAPSSPVTCLPLSYPLTYWCLCPIAATYHNVSVF